VCGLDLEQVKPMERDNCWSVPCPGWPRRACQSELSVDARRAVGERVGVLEDGRSG